MNETRKQNRDSWDKMADSYLGTDALPIYGCFVPTEDELHLFPDLSVRRFWISAVEAGILWSGAKKEGQQNYGDWIYRPDK